MSDALCLLHLLFVGSLTFRRRSLAPLVPILWESSAPPRRKCTLSAEQKLQQIGPQLQKAGFDVQQWFCSSQVNEHFEHPPLPNWAGGQAAGLLLGNSRALWPKFLRACSGELQSADPLDEYVEHEVTAALATLPERAWVGYAHTLRPAPLPFQRIAHHAGLASLGPAHLSIHPELGPWFALRAVIVWDIDGADRASLPPPSPCQGCAGQPCRQQWAEAIASDQSVAGEPTPRVSPQSDLQKTPTAEVSARAAPWLAVRDACPIGRQHRYGASQLRYHYDRQLPALGDRRP